MAEVYVSGQIESADGFADNRAEVGESSKALSKVKHKLIYLPSLKKPISPIQLNCIWPRRQYKASWPRIQLQVWHHDVYGRQELVGYGSLFLPSTPGEHELVCNMWRPKGTTREEMMQRFIGGGIQVNSLSILEDTTERMQISTVAMGRVRLRLYVITRHFEQFGILS
ncbi:B9 protein [Necator americanus]|uniref:B9 domain-containing protein 2 n=1 Tax=Necator americanus TaxID=51031 RepID=W2T4Z6_NECAM|nr:B9 protein [Necator americanus]ETN76973.1 B9 protein [Necator americanus]